MTTPTRPCVDRRSVLSVIGASAALVVTRDAFAAEAPDAGAAKESTSGAHPAEVTPTEDLMQEHGALRRILLVYGECIRRIGAGAPPPVDVVTTSANLIHTFVEGYHEKLEEQHLFPALEKAKKETDLVKVLRAQHAAGRKITDSLLKTTADALKNKVQATAIANQMQLFIRMYEPHAAREDTVLFPAFRSLYTEEQFDQLGEQFEDVEHQVLGAAGFEGTVQKVAQLEQTLGIYDLAQFTPK